MRTQPIPTWVRRMDWSRLRDQKAALTEMLAYLTVGWPQGKTPTPEQRERFDDAIEGLLACLDAMQDWAADELGIRGVFPKVETNDRERKRRAL